MGKRVIGATIKLDGEQTFRSAVNNATAAMKTMQSELALVSKSYATNANSMAALTAKHDALANVMSATKSVAAEQAKALEHAQSEYSRIGEELDKYKNALASARTELEKMRASGAGADAIAEQEQKVEALSKTVEKGQKTYDRAYKSVNTWQQKLNETNGSIVDLNAEIEKNDQYLAEAEQSADGAAKSIDKYGNALKNARSAGETLQKVGSGISSVGDTMSKYITLPIVGAATASSKLAMDFETSMAKVSTIAGNVDMDSMADQIRRISSEYGESATDIAEATYQAISAGQDASNAVDFVETSLKLAKSGFTDTSTAVDTLTTVLNAYKMSASDASSISDDLITTQNLGKTTVGELSESLGKIIPTASAANVSFEQLSAAYITLTKNGVRTREATTYLNGMISELSKSGSAASEALKAMTGYDFSELLKQGYSLEDVLDVLGQYAEQNGKKLGDMFGSQEAARSANAMAQGVADFNAGLKALRSNAGQTQTAFDKIMGTKAEQMAEAMQEIKNAGIKIGEDILPEIVPLAKKAADSVDKITKQFDRLPDSVKDTATNVALISAAAGPAMKTIGSTVSTIGTVADGVSKISKAAESGSAIASVASSVGKIGGYAGAVAAVGGAIAIAVDAAVNADEEFVQLQDDAYDAIDKSDRLIQKLQDNIASYQTIEDTATSRTDMAKPYIDVLDNMTDVSSRTRAEQEKYNDAIANLNALMPELNLSMDKSTGLLMINGEKVKNLSEYWNDVSKAAKDAAIQQSMQDTYSGMLATQQEYDENEKKLKALRAQQKEYDDALRQQAEYNMRASQTTLSPVHTVDIVTTTKSLKNQKAIDALEEKQEELNEKYHEGEEAVKKYAHSLDTVTETSEGVTATTDTASESVSVFAQAIHDAGDNLQESLGKSMTLLTDTKSKLEEFQDAAEQSAGSISSVLGNLTLKDKDNKDIPVLDAMNTALDSNADKWQQWADDAKTALDYATSSGDANVLALVQDLSDLGADGADQMHVLAEAIRGDSGELSDILANYGNISQARENWVAEMEKIKESTKETNADIVQDMEDNLKNQIEQLTTYADAMTYLLGEGRDKYKGTASEEAYDTIVSQFAEAGPEAYEQVAAFKETVEQGAADTLLTLEQQQLSAMDSVTEALQGFEDTTAQATQNAADTTAQATQSAADETARVYAEAADSMQAKATETADQNIEEMDRVFNHHKFLIDKQNEANAVALAIDAMRDRTVQTNADGRTKNITIPNVNVYAEKSEDPEKTARKVINQILNQAKGY